MLKDVVVPAVKSHLHLANRIHCLPFKWDETNKRIVPSSTQTSQLKLGFSVFLHGLYVVYQAFTIVSAKHSLLAADKFVAGLILTVNAFCFGTRLASDSHLVLTESFNRIISGQGMPTRPNRS